MIRLALLGCLAQGGAGATELVMAHETLRVSGDKLPAQLDAFLRRLEATGGWRPGSLAARAFVSPSEALAHLKKGRAAFAIIPVHQFLQGRKALRLEVVGRSVGLEGAEPAFWGIARKGTVDYQHVELRPGLRLAGTELDDLAWLSNVVFETNVRAEKHFRLLPVKTPADAIAAVSAAQADVALVYETDYRRQSARLEPEGDLVAVYSSAVMPPSPVVALPGRARPADRKKLAVALPRVCEGEGSEMCARLGILKLESGKAESYRNIIEKYAH